MQEKSMQLPALVRQVGKVAGENRVYIEDYAYGYLCELKNKCNVLPVRAALYGNSFKKDNIRYYFVYGACCVTGEGEGKSSAEHCDKQFFGDYELIGYVNLYRKGEMPGEKQGCYIFYENNEAMQNYLLSCKAEQSECVRKPLQAMDGQEKYCEECIGYLKEASRKILLGMLVVIAAVAVATINHYDRIYEFAAMAIKAAQEIR